MTLIDRILKKEGIVKHNGKLIYPGNGKWWVYGYGFGTLPEAMTYIDNSGRVRASTRKK